MTELRGRAAASVRQPARPMAGYGAWWAAFGCGEGPGAGVGDGVVHEDREGGLPFRDRPVDEREDEGVDDLIADRLACLQHAAQVGTSLLGAGPARPVTAAGKLDGGRGEAVRRTAPGPSHQTGIHPGQPERGVAEQDEWDRCGCGSGRPEDAGDLAEGEFAFEDVVIEALLSSESHGGAFRECS